MVKFQDIERDDDSGRISSFKMHDLVHDLAQSISSHESYAMEEPCSTDSSPGTRHLSIAYYGSRLHKTCNLLEKVETLRSLVFLYCGDPVDLTISSSLKHTRLRALNWSGLDEKVTNFPSSIGVLKHLRYLNLCGSDITELPDSIGSLWNLQTLDVSYCNQLKRYPVSIGRLRNLRHLYNTLCDNLSSMPQSMVGLTSLRTLNIVVVGEHEKKEFQLSGLEHLKYLRGKVLQIICLERVRDAIAKYVEKANLKEKKDLHELDLIWNDENGDGVADQQEQILILEALRPSPMLKHMSLFGYKGISFSNWLMKELASFKYIQTLFPDCCENCTQLPPLWRLPSLKKLYFQYLSSLKYLIESGENCCAEEWVSFPTLQSLVISNLPRLQRIVSGEDADQQFNSSMIFPCLSELVIRSCPKLNTFNSGPLPSLRSLEFRENERIVLSMFTSGSYNLQSLHSLKKLDISSCDSVVLSPILN